MSADWGRGATIKPWPKPGPEEPPLLFSADFQEYDGSWTNIKRDVPLREAISAVRTVRKQHRVPPETRVR